MCNSQVSTYTYIDQSSEGDGAYYKIGRATHVEGIDGANGMGQWTTDIGPGSRALAAAGMSQKRNPTTGPPMWDVPYLNFNLLFLINFSKKKINLQGFFF